MRANKYIFLVEEKTRINEKYNIIISAHNDNENLFPNRLTLWQRRHPQCAVRALTHKWAAENDNLIIFIL